MSAAGLNITTHVSKIFKEKKNTHLLSDSILAKSEAWTKNVYLGGFSRISLKDSKMYMEPFAEWTSNGTV